jgi:hypothetical protein
LVNSTYKYDQPSTSNFVYDIDLDPTVTKQNVSATQSAISDDIIQNSKVLEESENIDIGCTNNISEHNCLSNKVDIRNENNLSKCKQLRSKTSDIKNSVQTTKSGRKTKTPNRFKDYTT